MADSNASLESAAVALWCGIWEGGDAWELATDSEKATARSWTQAVIDALLLRQEWQIRTDGAYFGRTLSLAEAEDELARRKAVEAATPSPSDWDRNPEIVHRYVTSWVVLP